MRWKNEFNKTCDLALTGANFNMTPIFEIESMIDHPHHEKWPRPLGRSRDSVASPAHRATAARFQSSRQAAAWRATVVFAALALVVGLVASGPVVGQSNDSVFLKPDASGRGGVERGRIVGMTPDSIELEKRGTSVNIDAWRIRKITYSSEPSELDRARDRMEDGRFADCLTELAKISERPDNEFIAQEIDFYKAYCSAMESLMGGDITAQQAGTLVRDFVRNYPQSYHYYPAVELLGQLLVGINKPDLAAAEFAKLAESRHPGTRVRGLYLQGNALLLAGQTAEARRAFEAVANADGTDDESQNYKLLAECGLAKVMAMEGDPDGGQAIAEKIIAEESSENSELFANAYNALGLSHMQAGRLMDAAMAFLHTDLLYANESEAHAEALYYLARIWPQLEFTDRADRARQTLKTRYRNSFWAQQL